MEIPDSQVWARIFSDKRRINIAGANMRCQGGLAAAAKGSGFLDLFAVADKDHLDCVTGPLGSEDIDQVVKILDTDPGHLHDQITFV